MVRVTIGKGDQGYQLRLTVTESDGTVRDLTGYTATFYAWNPSTPDTMVSTIVATSTAPTSGLATVLLSTDFSASAYYEAKLVLTAAGLQDTVEHFLVAIPDSASYYASLTELKDELDLTGNTHDYRLIALIQQARKFIDMYCHRTFVKGSSGTVKYYDGCDELWIDDCTNVESIRIDEEMDGTWSSTMSSTTPDYLLKPYNRNPKTEVVLSSNSNYSTFADGVTKGVMITGTFEYDTTIPEDIRRAAITQIGHWWQRSKGGYAQFAGPTEFGMTIEKGLDPDVKAILDPYRRITYAL